MNAVSRHCKGGTCITYPTCGLFLELVRINTGMCLYNALQRSEVPLTLSFALTVGMSPVRGHFILVMFLSDVFCPRDPGDGGLSAGEKGRGTHGCLQRSARKPQEAQKRSVSEWQSAIEAS